MTTYTYGQSPNDFVEVPDPDRPGQTMRPDAGRAVQVRDAATLADLTPITTGPYGYLTFTTTSPSVNVSTDGFGTSKRLYGLEALDAAVGAGTSAANAVIAANAAVNAVTGLSTRVTDVENTLANSGGGGGGGGTGGYAGAAPGTIVVWPTPDKAGQLLLRPTSRLDVIVDWNLDTYPPEGSGYLIPGVDRFTDTSP